MLTLIPISSDDQVLLFERVKTGIFPFVEQVFGWDDGFQRQRMARA